MIPFLSSLKRCAPAYAMVAMLVVPVLLSCNKKELESSMAPVSNSSTKMVTDASGLTSTFVAEGTILRDLWTPVSGNDVAQVPVASTPTSSTPLTAFEIPLNAGENYGDRIRGYIVAPVTGSYTFWIAADDSGELWLSTNDDPANKKKIASLLSYSSSRQWNKFASQKSAAITLQAGAKYYIEALHKQGGGGGNLAVQWMLPGGAVESPIPGSRLISYTATDNNAYTVSPVINLYDKHDITISGKFISGGTEPLITLSNCSNIHITGNKLANSSKVGIYLYKCKNITIDDNYITAVSSGVYAEQTTDGGIVVNNNQFLNMKGPFPRGQFVQFNNVRGPGSSIIGNKGENIMGQSYPEDAINLYQSAGTPASPIMITGNWIRGGGPSLSGGGIMLGDNGGSYLTAMNNILVNPGQFGMAIAGGDHHVVTNNTIYGVQQSFTNVGLYVNDINGYTTSNCTVTSNKVKYYNKTNYQNNAWLSPNSAKPTGWDANTWGAAIDPSVLPAVIITKK